MVCFSEDCFWVKKHGDCFYDGLMPSNHPKTHEECEFFKTPTNYDRIISKTPEELAGWLYSLNDEHCDSVCPPANPACMLQENCMKCWLDWLRRETAE